MSSFEKVYFDTLMRNLDREIAEIKYAIRTAEIDLLSFDDVNETKTWLKMMKRKAVDMDDLDDCPF